MTADILARAARHDFDGVGAWLAAESVSVNTPDARGWTVLHYAAAAEALGKDTREAVELLLKAGADPHQPDNNGDTPFNIAAANSPVAGRLMTNRWLDNALEGRGKKRLNDRSGSHGSTLAQYMAKWLEDGEIEARLKLAVEAGMKPDVANASGWTPLTAAAAMGRVKAVEAFMEHYDHAAMSIETAEAYTATYQGHKVTYPAGQTAAEVAFTRLGQDRGLLAAQKAAYVNVTAIIILKLSGH